jgi:hypothetical protein
LPGVPGLMYRSLTNSCDTFPGLDPSRYRSGTGIEVFRRMRLNMYRSWNSVNCVASSIPTNWNSLDM